MIDENASRFRIFRKIADTVRGLGRNPGSSRQDRRDQRSFAAAGRAFEGANLFSTRPAPEPGNEHSAYRAEIISTLENSRTNEIKLIIANSCAKYIDSFTPSEASRIREAVKSIENVSIRAKSYQALIANIDKLPQQVKKDILADIGEFPKIEQAALRNQLAQSSASRSDPPSYSHGDERRTVGTPEQHVRSRALLASVVRPRVERTR